MVEPTLFERPFTAAYDEAIMAFVAAHPEPGPTYAEIKALLFPPVAPQSVLPIAPGASTPPRDSASRSWPASSPSYSSTSGLEPSSGYLLGLPLGLALGMMF